MLQRMLVDMRHAARALRRRPGYVTASAAILILVLGANTALFAAINATLLRPIPLTPGHRSVRLFTMAPGEFDPAESSHELHEAELLHFRERTKTVSGLGSFVSGERTLTIGGETLVVPGASASAELLRLSPEAPILGRAYDEAEDRASARIVVLGEGLWRRAFEGRPDVLGQAIALDGEPFEIVGVMPESFPPHFLRAELWTPLGIGAPIDGDGAGRANLVTLAGLAEGVDLETARAEIGQLMEEVVQERPGALRGWRAGVMEVREWQYGDLRLPFFVMIAAMVLLVTVACANIATLAMAQISDRARELAVRRALGAGAAKIARLVLIEILAVNLIGVSGGLVLAHALLPLLLRIDPATAALLGPVTIDAGVMAYAVACAVAASVAATALPALHATKSSMASNIASGGSRARGRRGRGKWRDRLLVGQAALCLALLVTGALLLKALLRVAATDPGFQPGGVLTAQLRLSPQRHDTHEDRVQLIEEIMTRVAAQPGVRDVAIGLNEFAPGLSYVVMVHVQDHPTPDGNPTQVHSRRVSAGYFRALGIPLVAGRVFDDRDAADADPSAVISASFAGQFWPGESPLGRRVTTANGRNLTVVGVVADVADVSLLEAPEPTIYVTWTQLSTPNAPVALLVRVSGDPNDFAGGVREAVRSVDPLLPVDRIQPLQTFLEDALAPPRFRATLVMVLALIGLVLGALGIAALTAQTIAERAGELGVRLALGGDRRELWTRAVKGQLRQVGIGLAIGAGLAAVGGQVITTLIPDVIGFDVAATVVSAGVLAVTATLSAGFAAVRVLRMDPALVLRKEG